MVAGEGSGEEGEVLTLNVDFKSQVDSSTDLTLKINQNAFVNGLNDNDAGDNVIFSDMKFEVAPAEGGTETYVMSGKASMAEQTTLDQSDFAAKAKEAIENELMAEGAEKPSFENEEVEKMSCTDGQNGGCSHFCSDNSCSCPTCWELGADLKNCHPSDGMVTITCSSEEMTLSVDKCVLASADDMKLLDPSCKPELNDDKYDVSTGLDSCGTTFELDADSQIVTFTNQLIAPPEIVNGLIMSRSTAMEFECQYGTAYDDVSNNRTVIGGKVVTSASAQKGTFGTGSLGFSLNFYTTSKYDELVDSDAMIMVGETLHFAIEAATGISGLVFTVLDCTVSDPLLSAEYDILTDQCPDKFVGTTVDTLSDALMMKMSYTAFQFAGTVGTETQEKLSCSVLVCDENSGDGPCATEPTCADRKRREAPQGQLFYVSQKFKLRK